MENHLPRSGRVYQYTAPWQVYAMDWFKTYDKRLGFRLAIGSFIEEVHNKIQVIARTHPSEGYTTSNESDFTIMAEADTYYPLTKLLWQPAKGYGGNAILATTSDILRLWELVDNPMYGNTSNSITGGHQSPGFKQELTKRAELMSVKHSDLCAPLTSFDWNEQDPSLIVTASIDTTCTVWNVETRQAKTRLIAHDEDVYDVAFMPGSADVFASVGADGSVRCFDLRTLEHSTILYEAPPRQAPNQGSRRTLDQRDKSNALLRLQFSPVQHNYLATFHIDSSTVQIIDIRYPSMPVVVLTDGHHGNVNCLSWSPTKPAHMCTGGDDAQMLIWDFAQVQAKMTKAGQQSPFTIKKSEREYTTPSPIHSVSWNRTLPEWIGVGFGNTVQALQL